MGININHEALFSSPNGELERLEERILGLFSQQTSREVIREMLDIPSLALSWIRLVSEDIFRQERMYRELKKVLELENTSIQVRILRHYDRVYGIARELITPEFVEDRVESCSRDRKVLNRILKQSEMANEQSLYDYAERAIEASMKTIENHRQASRSADMSQPIEEAQTWMAFWACVQEVLGLQKRADVLANATYHETR